MEVRVGLGLGLGGERHTWYLFNSNSFVTSDDWVEVCALLSVTLV